MVAERTYAEIAGCDAAFHFTRNGGVTFPFRGTGVTVPRLDEALRAARYLGVLANLEIKNVPTEPDYDPKPGRTVRAVVAAITTTGALHIVTVSSFWPVNLDWIELKLPGVRTALLTQGDPSGLSPTSPRFPCVANVAFSIVRRYEVSQPEYLSADMAPCARVARVAGHPVQVWTVDDPAALAAMVALRVDGIITNRPDLLLEVLGRR
jgi:glycerophosphoryl diester phosphodiesterase